MRLFAIGDLHMSGGGDKPMDIFGAQWDRHFLHIQENWERQVGPEDTVLIPGDISWAMKLEDAVPDLETIGRLPGKKVICRGNHDYWWHSITRVREALPEGMIALQADAADLGEWVVCGTRGWLIPVSNTEMAAEDRKIYRREVQRLQMALDRAVEMAGSRPIVVMMHYPPLLKGERQSDFTTILEEHGVTAVVYGHLHGPGIMAGFNGVQQGVVYTLVSCDSIGFSPKEVPLEMNSEAAGTEY